MIRACKAGWMSVLFAITGVVAGCGSGDGPDGEGPSATIIIDGSSTVVRISKAAQEGFKSIDPAVVVVDSHGTGAGFHSYLRGEIDIVDASRLPRQTKRPRRRSRVSTGPDSSSATTGSRWSSIPRTTL